jgi:hypothetical protein
MCTHELARLGERVSLKHLAAKAGMAPSIGFAALSAPIFDYRNEIAAASISKSLGMPSQWPVAKAA